MHCILISTLAEYQTVFWRDVGLELQRQGLACEFLSFDDRSTEMLADAGLKVHGMPLAGRTHSDGEDRALLAAYGVETPEAWYLHERMAFGENDPVRLRRKLCSALRMADAALEDCSRRFGSVQLVQEVGGFLSVVGCFLAARKQGIANWFIEPAFFKGRLFFTRDSFGSPRIVADPSPETEPAVRLYLEQARAQQRIVIPEKDRHHYSPALAKVANVRNALRLLRKLSDKYLRGKRQEFGYIGHHVSTHLRMLRNSLRLRGHYASLSSLGSFVYFPLHVPGDMALTLRSPRYLDQLALLEQLLRAAPADQVIAVKEHPAMVGALDAARLRTLCARHEQLRVLPPSTNNYDVIRAAGLVVSINSKSGAEALLLDRPVLVLGDAFYSDCPFVVPGDTGPSLPAELKRLCGPVDAPSVAQVVHYFHRVWDSCQPGELYVTTPDNVRLFAQSMVAAIGDNPVQKANE